MIRPENETEDFLLSILKIVKHSFNKLVQNLRKHLNLKSSNEEKYFSSIHQFILKEFG